MKEKMRSEERIHLKGVGRGLEGKRLRGIHSNVD